VTEQPELEKKPVFDLSLLVDEPTNVYHARASEFMSSHQLIDFIKCPLLHQRKRLGLIPDLDSAAYLVGRAAHTLILEGDEAYANEYAIGGPINEKTGRPFGNTTKAWQEWADAQGKAVLTFGQADTVAKMAAAVRGHEAARDLLSAGKAEGVLRSSYCDAPCQVRIDWMHPDLGIVDLKTCNDAAYFEFDAKRFHYHHQLAFYREAIWAATGLRLPVTIIAVEKSEPFRAGVWRVTDVALDMAAAENADAMRRLRNCREDDCWPTLFEDVRYLTIVSGS